jgi:hypothetical protein
MSKPGCEEQFQHTDYPKAFINHAPHEVRMLVNGEGSEDILESLLRLFSITYTMPPPQMLSYNPYVTCTYSSGSAVIGGPSSPDRRF